MTPELSIPIITSKLYCIFDNVARELVGTIIRVANDEVARRSFHDALQQPNTPVASHPADFDLLFLGSVDQLGNITAGPVDVLARGADWLAANKENNK